MLLTRNIPAILILLSVAFASGCTSFTPLPLEEVLDEARIQTEEAGGLRVSVAMFNREEAAALFGVNLHQRGVQPVWLEIENQSEKSFWFMMHGLDPDYFTAHEVAYMNHFFMSGEANRQMDDYFSELGIKQQVVPGETVSGFAFSNETIGTKEVRVRLYSNKDVRTFEFFVSVPGRQSEWEEKDLRDIYSADDSVPVETEQELRKVLLTLPCCTIREDGGGEGDAINVVMIGGIDILKAMIKAGWDETAFKQDLRSLFGAAYFDGRPPDVQFEKTRRAVDSTNLLRLWTTPILYKGEIVAVGSISRNIDPAIDEAAMYLAEDLATAHTVRAFGFVGGVGEASQDEPRWNFANDPYWTNGNRIVLQFADTPTELDEIDMFDWNWEGRKFPGSSTESTSSE